MKILIAVDDSYKLKIFEAELLLKGYKFVTGPGLTAWSKHIYVFCTQEELPELTRVIERCVNIAAALNN